MSDDRKREKIRRFAAMYGGTHSFESLTGRTQSAGPNIQTNVPKSEEFKDVHEALAKHLFGDPKDFPVDSKVNVEGVEGVYTYRGFLQGEKDTCLVTGPDGKNDWMPRCMLSPVPPDYTGIENRVVGRMVASAPDYGPLKNPLVGEPDTLAARANGSQIPKYTWHCSDPDGPVCQMCDEPFDNELGEFLFDAATVQGPWAVMDETCFNTYSRRMLGEGYGQKYQLQPVAGLPGGRAWVKVDG